MATTSRLKRIVTWSAIAVVVALFVLKTFFIGYYRIPQNGRYPTLPAGSIFFTLKRPYRNVSSVKRGDIIVFLHEQNGRQYKYTWRVIGLPGEKIQVSGDSLTINGRPVGREHLSETDGKTISREQIGDVSYQIAFDSSARDRPPDALVTVPPEHLFVMGDNRFRAFDSRYFGPISLSSIVGKKL